MSHPLKWLALVPLARPELPAFAHVAAWHAERYPGGPPLVAAGSTDKLLTFTIGDYTAAATLVPRAIPWSQLAGPCESAWYWPDAAATLRGHNAHLLVTLVDEAGPAVEKATQLTRLTAALTATSPAVGVFWGPGRLVHPPAAFIDQAREAPADDLPLFLWVDFRVEPQDAGGCRAFTTGLGALGGDELEVERYAGPPQSLVQFLYNVAHYQLVARKAIDDGHTIGLSDDVQATVRRGPSMLGGDLEVLKLELE